VDKAEINSILYGVLRGKVAQDKAYRWWPRESKNVEGPDSTLTQKLDTPLSRICSYYLDCLNHDDQGGVSVFASSNFGLDYAELTKMPAFSGSSEELFENEAVRKLLSRVRRDRGRLSLALGYPVLLKKIRSKKGWEGFIVAPIFLFGFRDDASSRYASPALTDEMPQINYTALRSLTSADRTNVVDEVVHLSLDLGFEDPDFSIPDIDELMLRLRSLREEWDWKEEPDPTNLRIEPSLSSLKEEGIYNRAIVLLAERSPYTKGLETELRLLQSVPQDQYKDTALGKWLHGGDHESKSLPGEALLEVLPMNSEQRQSVHHSLNNPLTVITGPPGTGKSQVVTSILINAAYQGKKVLFASKNNKAVDVVETRVNALGPRPILLRLGSGELQARLAEYLISLLSATASQHDRNKYKESMQKLTQNRSRLEALDAEMDETIRIRNLVDKLEQDIEAIRKDVDVDLFRSFKTVELDKVNVALTSFKTAVTAADKRQQTFMVKLFWSFIRNGRFNRLREETALLGPVAESLGLSLPAGDPDDACIDSWLEHVSAIEERVASARKVQTYFQALAGLNRAEPLEQISRKRCECIEALADVSTAVWESWLKLQPDRLTQADRKLLRDYGSLLQMISTGQDAGERLSKKVFSQYNALFPKITSILSCWAITSLSARGRVPFEPAFFDLLVIDEASQCDIASAIPLLYRAKRAVIIGDPKQLRHISALPQRQDRQLLAKNDLVEGYASWAYSVNSLFDLASGICRSEDIIDLRDHHRSHSDIISFSNEHFYEGRLRVATRYNSLRKISATEPAVRWINVKGKVNRPASGGAYNPQEAMRVVDEIERLVVQQGYSGSIGVVSPFRAQANLIRELTYKRENLIDRLTRNDFLADTVHRFQGDERDVMIFSPTVSEGTSEGAFNFLRNNPNLFNVAITRARAGLLVVGDQEVAANSSVDYLSKFAKYVMESRGKEGTKIFDSHPCGPDYPPVARPELVSEWEKVLYKALYVAGIRPIPQYDVEKYILDFAILNGQRKLNIEVDGERYHRNWDGELCWRDQIRNQRLIELGWDVMRFWVYQIRDDLDYCVNRVAAWISSNH